ncbi:ABC transporter permease [Desulfococcus sp.]|uniref:ABC transporter permease n=1 Tax=Desulfococcus sp. TaxID=2025834 RepID=UPI003593E138
MSIHRIWVMFKARNAEFFRDRAAFGWNFLFPFLMVGGFGLIFGDDTRGEYKIGIFPYPTETVVMETAPIPEGLKAVRMLQFVGFRDFSRGIGPLRHHKIDLLVEIDSPAPRYWVTDSPKGDVAEKIFTSAMLPPECRDPGRREEIRGTPIRYIDWLFPGILAMNMMFSALWGVGFVIVRYRKNGVLKRLKATPLTPFEYLTAQMLSRIFLLTFTLVIMWVGCDLFFDFNVQGSYINLVITFFIGGLSLCAMGLVVAARGTSEEFASGVVNFIGWPMMFLSEVWFSLEGAPRWLKFTAEAFPLTHMLRAVRGVMNDGAGLSDVGTELAILSAMTLIFLVLGSWMFSWNE